MLLHVVICHILLWKRRLRKMGSALVAWHWIYLRWHSHWSLIVSSGGVGRHHHVRILIWHIWLEHTLSVHYWHRVVHWRHHWRHLLVHCVWLLVWLLIVKSPPMMSILLLVISTSRILSFYDGWCKKLKCLRIVLRHGIHSVEPIRIRSLLLLLIEKFLLLFNHSSLVFLLLELHEPLFIKKIFHHQSLLFFWFKEFYLQCFIVYNFKI